MEKEMLQTAKEMEVLEFIIEGSSYGIDVNDIREILNYEDKCTPVPNAHSNIEGIIMPRDFVITIIDLVKALKLTKSDAGESKRLIVTSIHDLNIAFYVDSISGIHKISSGDITKPGKKLSTTAKDIIEGILNISDSKIELINFRKIFQGINPEVNVG